MPYLIKQRVIKNPTIEGTNSEAIKIQAKISTVSILYRKTEIRWSVWNLAKKFSRRFGIEKRK
jgi:hypothetical protein